MINSDINAQVDSMVSAENNILQTNDFEQPEQSLFTGEEEQVAGLAGMFTKGAKALKPIQKSITREIKPIPEKAVKKTPSEQVKEMAIGAEKSGIAEKAEAVKAGKIQQKVNEEPQVTVEQLQKSVEEIKPELENKFIPAEELKPGVAEFNLPLLDDSLDLAPVVKAITSNANIKTQNITFDDVVKSAKEAGMDSTFISKLTDGKITVNPENTYLALEAQKSSAIHLESLMRKFEESPESITPAVELEAMQTIAFHSLIQRSVKNYQTNVAQSLAVMRIPRTGFINLDEATGGLMDGTSLRKFAKAFLAETDAGNRAKLIDSTATSGWRDKTFSVFVNNILSRPSTHVKNFLSNTIMIPVRMTEKVGAAAIGGTRKAVGLGPDEQYYATEVLSSMAATKQAIADGWKMAAFSAKEGYSSTIVDANKINLAKSRTEIFDYKTDNPMAAFLKGANFVATLPGRSLMVADEFFKGVNYRFELESAATRDGIKAYDDAVKLGSNQKDAESAYDLAAQNIFDNPPEDLMALAQEATFTKPLDGWAKKAQDFINDDSNVGFLARLQVPFVTTPVNLMLQTLERTPLAPLTKKVRGDLAKGGKDADLAMSKIGLGTGAAVLFSSYANDGALTGAGPADKGQRDALGRQGWQPYSLVFNFSELSETEKLAFSKLPMNVQYGSGDYNGKVFVSYQGMEPLGAFLAMSSNYTEYVKYENDNSKIDAVRAGLVYGFYDYMMTSPFLQGISNISSALGATYRSNQDDAVKLVDTLEKSLVTFAGKTVVPLSGLVTSMREKTDPYQREYRVDENAESLLPKGVKEGINEVINSTPGLSDTLPLKLNMWGEPVEYEYSWSPIRMKAGKQKEADQVIIQTGTKVKMPTKKYSTSVEKGISVEVDLSPVEYNEMLTIANDTEGLNLQQRIYDVSEDIVDLPLYRQQKILSDIIQETFSKAKDILYTNSAYSLDLQQRVQDRADIIREVGMGAK